MEGVLCTCSLVFFLLISFAVNASQGVFSEDVNLFPFYWDKALLEKDQSNTPQQSPLASPSPSPAERPCASHLNSINNHPPSGKPKRPRTNRNFDSKPVKKGLNNGKMAGLVLIAIAGALQVVVLTYLLVKRRQMLRVVEKYEV